MKTITCRQMGGVCDEGISGETPDEVMNKGYAHVQNATDEAHKELMAKMQNISNEDLEGWKAEFQKTWDATPDA